MGASFTNLVRVLLLAAALAFAGQTASAARPSTEPVPTATARTTAHTETGATAQPDEPPLDGLLIIAGIVGAVILLAWVCSRIGDSHSHVTS